MKTYKITISTNGYQASRNARYSWTYDSHRNATAIIRGGLTLKEAQKLLTEIWNDVFENERGLYLKNWGLIRANFPGETATHPDGTRSFDNDGYYYRIEADDSEDSRYDI